MILRGILATLTVIRSVQAVILLIISTLMEDLEKHIRNFNTMAALLGMDSEVWRIFTIQLVHQAAAPT